MPGSHSTPVVVGLATQVQKQEMMITAPNQHNIEMGNDAAAHEHIIGRVNPRCLVVSCGALAGVAAALSSRRALTAPNSACERVLRTENEHPLFRTLEKIQSLIEDGETLSSRIEKRIEFDGSFAADQKNNMQGYPHQLNITCSYLHAVELDVVGELRNRHLHAGTARIKPNGRRTLEKGINLKLSRAVSSVGVAITFAISVVEQWGQQIEHGGLKDGAKRQLQIERHGMSAIFNELNNLQKQFSAELKSYDLVV